MDDVAVRLGITLVGAQSRLLRECAELKQRLERQFGAFERTIVPA